MKTIARRLARLKQSAIRLIAGGPGAVDSAFVGPGVVDPAASRALCPGSMLAEEAPVAPAGSDEGAWKESQDRLDALFECVETGIFIIDPATHMLVDANSVAARMVGAPREKIVGNLCHKFVCPAQEGSCPVTDLGQTVDNSERVLLTAAGERRAIIKTVRPVVVSGQPRLLESFVDITDRKRAEEALKERSAYLHSLIEVSPLGIVVLDAERRVEISNAAFERLFLYSRAETQGKCLDDLIVPPELVAEANALRQQCHDTGNLQATTRRLRKDGTPVDVRLFAAPLEIDRKARGYLSLYEDIGAEIQAEKAMAERHRLADLAAKIGGVLTGSANLQQSLKASAEILAAKMDLALARICAVNEPENEKDLEASAGFDISLDTSLDSAPHRASIGAQSIGAQWIDAIAESGAPRVSDHVPEDSWGTDSQWARQQGVVAFAGYPLKVKDRTLGVMAAFARQPLSDAALQTFASVADNIAQFIERKRTEESLRNSEDRFRTAFDDAPYGMCMTAPDGHFMHANTALCAMLGYSAAELQTGAWQQLTHPHDIERSRQAVIELSRADRSSIELEKRYLRKDGSIMWGRTRILPLKKAGGEISHYVAQIEDVTLRKQADEAQAFLVSLVESSQDAIVGMNLQGNIVSWNRGAQELHGYTAEEMIGKHCSVVVLPERIGVVQQILETVRRGEPVARYETALVRKDGVRVAVTLTLSSVRDADGSVTGIAMIAHDITERKRSEQQSHLQTAALESAANGILIADCSGKIQWVNPAFQRLTGYAAEEVLGQTPRVLRSDVQDDSFYRTLWATILRGEIWHGEIVNRRKDGSRYDEEMTITPVRAADGSIKNFVAIKQDITERKREQEELLFKTTLLETEAETTIDGILVIDRKGRRIQSNRRFAEMFKIPQELLDGDDEKLLLDYGIHRVHDPAEFIHRIQYLYAHESERALDEIQLTDGQCIDRYTAPLQDATGRYYGRIWYFRDITDRKRAEQALRENEHRYRELFENASEIIFTTDLEGRFTSLNLAGQRAFGYSQQEAAEANLWEIVAPEFGDVLKQDHAQLMAGETQLTSEIEVTSKDGRRVRLEVKPRLIFHDETPVGVQAIARDITGRNIAEMELRHAQKLESVGRLASGIAHEINTPIQFVGDNTRFLADSFDSLKSLLAKFGELRDAVAAGSVGGELLAEVRRAEEESDCAYLLEEIPRAVSQTMEGVDRVATIVRAMKEFAHPESREMTPADLNKALLSTITVARNEWKYVAEIENDFAELPPVICNVGDLNQVFLNLLVNAAHAIADVAQDGGKGRITIRTAVEGDTVHISIADNGAGIPEGIRSKIFDPFFTTKEVGRGTGQGLAIARSVVVERHKGTLTFDSEVGKGTTFHIRLPISSEEIALEAKVR